MYKIILSLLIICSLSVVPQAKADSATGNIFSITKAVAPTTISPNSILAYSLTIKNISSINAAPQVINDTLPAGFTYVGNSKLTTVTGNQIEFAPTISGQILTWTFDGDTLQSVPPNQTIVISYQVKASSTPGVYQNRACIIQPENICSVANVNVAINPNASLESNVILGILIGSILLVVALSIPKKRKSFEDNVLSRQT